MDNHDDEADDIIRRLAHGKYVYTSVVEYLCALADLHTDGVIRVNEFSHISRDGAHELGVTLTIVDERFSPTVCGKNKSHTVYANTTKGKRYNHSFNTVNEDLANLIQTVYSGKHYYSRKTI